MENNEILKISLKNQLKLWEKCPFCGRKPKEVLWQTGGMTVGCDECISKPFSTVGYGEDENNFADVMQDLRGIWNKMCVETRESLKKTKKK